MKLLVAYTKGNKNLLKLALDDGTEKWATTTSAVLAYAKKNFQPQEEARFEMTEKNGQYHVTKILKADGSSAGATYTTETSSTTDYKCEDCGKILKDGKYKKCFDCNKKTPPKSTESSGGQRDIVGMSIEKQAMMKASANAVAIAMQGQISDVGLLADMIIVVYEKLYKKLVE